MSAHPPPVPPEQHGTSPALADVTDRTGREDMSGMNNTGEQGQAGNTKQNTTNKGLQQDR